MIANLGYLMAKARKGISAIIGPRLLMEDGNFLLQENGSFILLE